MTASKKKKSAAKTLAENRKKTKSPAPIGAKTNSKGNRKASKTVTHKNVKVAAGKPLDKANKVAVTGGKVAKHTTVKPARKNLKIAKVLDKSQTKTNVKAQSKKSRVSQATVPKTLPKPPKSLSKPVAPKQSANKTPTKTKPDAVKRTSFEEKFKSVSTKVTVSTKVPTKVATVNNGKAVASAPKLKVSVTSPQESAPPPSNTKPEIVAKIRSAQAEKELRKDLAQTAPISSLTPLNPVPAIVKGKDRLVLMVRDPYWIHAHWDIMRHSVDRAKAALAENWHTVKPILRLLKLDDSGTTNNSEVIYRDIEIHGGVRNWYIDVDSPPSRFKMLMGYYCANGRFYELARSNIITTPAPGGKEATDDHWADISTDAEHIYSMSGGYGDDTQTGDLTEVFEEKLKRTMDADVLSQFGSGAEGSLKRHKQFHFDVNAELVVFGSTHPEAHVSVGPEPVKVRSDGSFSIRLPLPDRRQVLPATAKSRDGVDEQTVVIAVERNTKVMEPLSSDSDDL